MYKAFMSFLNGLGALWVLIGAFSAIILTGGWFMNIYKLCKHLPLFDIETLVRVAGILPIVGGIVGWF